MERRRQAATPFLCTLPAALLALTAHAACFSCCLLLSFVPFALVPSPLCNASVSCLAPDRWHLEILPPTQGLNTRHAFPRPPCGRDSLGVIMWTAFPHPLSRPRAHLRHLASDLLLGLANEASASSHLDPWRPPAPMPHQPSRCPGELEWEPHTTTHQAVPLVFDCTAILCLVVLDFVFALQ